jgi:hypothetical protein
MPIGMSSIEGDIDLIDKHLLHLPTFLNRVNGVNGYFYCGNNLLKLLKGAPVGITKLLESCIA